MSRAADRGSANPVVLRQDALMECEQARQLFDAYLDGELSPGLRTELGAHQLQCEECRRALALLEVTGHIITADDELPAGLDDGFADRLLACMATRRARSMPRLRRIFYLGGGLAAAAVVGLALIGVFDSHGKGLVAGKTVERADLTTVELDDSLADFGPAEDQPEEVDSTTRALDSFLQRTRQNIDAIQDAFDLTILQTIDILEEAKKEPAANDHFPSFDGAPDPLFSDPHPPDGHESEPR